MSTTKGKSKMRKHWDTIAKIVGLLMLAYTLLVACGSNSNSGNPPKSTTTPVIDYGATAEGIATATGTSQNPSTNWVQADKNPCSHTREIVICDHLQFGSPKKLSIVTSGAEGSLTITIDQPKGQPGSTLIGTFKVSGGIMLLSKFQRQKL